MKGVDINVPFVEKASRLELVFRLLYLIPYFIIAGIFGAIVMYIVFPLEVLCILILGKRIGVLNNLIHSFVKWTMQYFVYIFTLTDERPQIIPSF
ncbi:MAG: DUF4389 domain-containing protein [Candidatus Micrarchaeia archaeon]